MTRKTRKYCIGVMDTSICSNVNSLVMVVLWLLLNAPNVFEPSSIRQKPRDFTNVLSKQQSRILCRVPAALRVKADSLSQWPNCIDASSEKEHEVGEEDSGRGSAIDPYSAWQIGPMVPQVK